MLLTCHSINWNVSNQQSVSSFSTLETSRRPFTSDTRAHLWMETERTVLPRKNVSASRSANGQKQHMLMFKQISAVAAEEGCENSATLLWSHNICRRKRSRMGQQNSRFCHRRSLFISCFLRLIVSVFFNEDHNLFWTLIKLFKALKLTKHKPQAVNIPSYTCPSKVGT